jgi:outer membrane protein assembly factor BamB
MVAFGRLLYISTTDDSLFAINQGNGTVEFSIAAEDEITAPPAIGAIDTGEQSGEPFLVFPTADGSVFGYSALRAGGAIWEAPAVGTVRGAPLIVGTAVVVATEEGNVISLDLGSGTELWRYPAEGPAGEFRGAVAHADGAIYAVDRSGSLHVIDLATGQSRCPGPIGLMSSSRVNPIVADGAVFVGLDELPGIQVSDAAGCGAPSPAFATNYPSGEPVLLPPAVNDGVLYLLEGPRLLAVNLDPATFPTQNYMWDSPFLADGPITTPPVFANGVVYVGSQNGKVYAVDATNGQGLWGEGFDVGAPVKGAAVVSNGAVFVSTARGQIWAIAGS